MPTLSSMTRLLAVLALIACTSAPSAARAGDRLLAIGDIHGAYEEFLELLQIAKLVDAQGDWIGGSARLVQTGDFTDRGSGVRDAMELLMKIERQAAAQGGQVLILLGNHEAMNLIYNDRDALVNPAIHASFADEESEARRKAALKQWQKWRNRRARIQERLLGDREVELSAELTAFIGQGSDEWLAAHPPGLIEYRQAFSFEGRYGSWLRNLPVAVKLDDTLFLHGGIGPSYQGFTLDEINELHRRRFDDWRELRRKLEKRRLVLPFFSWAETRLALEHTLYFPETPSDRELATEGWELLNAILTDLFAEGSVLWYRGYAKAPLGLEDEPLAALLDQTDQAYGVRRTVAAHSPIANHHVLERLDGRLFLIDTGMLRSYYGGRASALEITADGVSAIYGGAEEPEESLGTNGDGPGEDHAAVEGEPAERGSSRVYRGPDDSPLPFQSPEQIERFLRHATPISTKPVGQGKTGALKVLLELGGTRAHGIFHSIHEVEGSPTRPVVLNDGTKVMFFRDSYRSQVAVYELSKLMGMKNVPPAVRRKIDGRTGSLALWIENGINLFDWRERGDGDPTDPYLYQQMHDVRIFDNLVDNTDRNSQNIFWTEGFDIWLIDHTRTLSQNRQLLRPDRVSRCSREMYEGLRRLDPDQVQARLEGLISGFEIKALLKRRDKVLELLEKRIAKVGRDEVIFEYGDGLEVAYTPIEE